MTETKGGETRDETRPFAKLNGDDLYQLPDGTPHRISDVVALGFEGAYSGVPVISNGIRYVEEVRLIQAAIGVPQTGAIDEDTRTAFREIARYRWDDVGLIFPQMWMEAHNLAREAREKGQPALAAVAAYLHDVIVNGLRELIREEPLDVSAPRPTIEKHLDERSEPKVDVGSALVAVENARMRRCLAWIIRNKTAGANDIEAVAREGFGHSVDDPQDPSLLVVIERWAAEDALRWLAGDKAAVPIGLINYLKNQIAKWSGL